MQDESLSKQGITMPEYDYRCKSCGRRFTVFYKTYADYDSASPQCPHCQSADLSRLITRVALQKPSRDYASMEPNEMLSVLESGDSRQVGEMFQQVAGDEGMADPQLHEATQRLLKGENMEKVSRDMEAADSSGADSPGIE
jgi:putative FmdB family regulatory protein